MLLGSLLDLYPARDRVSSRSSKGERTDHNSRFLADGQKTYKLYKPQASRIFPLYQIRMRFLNSSHAGGHVLTCSGSTLFALRAEHGPSAWAVGRNGDRSFDLQRGSVPQEMRVCGEDGSGAEAALDRRQGEAVWNQQARQSLSPQDSDSWSSCCRVAMQARQNRDGCLDDVARDEGVAERVDRKYQ
jgi:hypothetical protein